MVGTTCNYLSHVTIIINTRTHDNGDTMDIQKLKRLAGLDEYVTEAVAVKPYQTTTITDPENKKSVKDNNKDTVKNKSAEDVRTDGTEPGKSPEAVKKVDPIDQNPKETKIVQTATYKIVIGKNGGAAKVDDNMEIKSIKVESWLAEPDYALPMYILKNTDDQYVTESNGSLMSGFDQQALIFADLEQAQQLAEAIGFSVYATKLVDPAIEKMYETLGQEIELGEPLSEAFDPSVNVKADIDNKLAQKQKVSIAVNYKGQMFNGRVTATADNAVHVIPSEKTIQRFGIKNPRQVLLPVDYKAMMWSDRFPDVVVGHAKEVDTNASPLNPNPGSQVANSGRGTIANFGQQKPAIGNPNDPSTFKIDMSSFDPQGNPLAEAKKEADKKVKSEDEECMDEDEEEQCDDVEAMKTESKNKTLAQYMKAIMEGSSLDELKKTLAGLRTELKAAKANDDDELISDVESDIADIQRKIAKATAAVTA
jgi:hypothetical protein